MWQDILGSHLDISKHSQLTALIAQFPCLVIHLLQHVMEHSIDVGESKPIKQRFYQVNPKKRKFLKAEFAYMLKNDIAEPLLSIWNYSSCQGLGQCGGGHVVEGSMLIM